MRQGLAKARPRFCVSSVGHYYTLPAESTKVRIKDVSQATRCGFGKWSGRSFALKDSVRRLANHLKRWLRWKRNRAFLQWTAIVGATNLDEESPADGDAGAAEGGSCARRQSRSARGTPSQ